MSFLNLGPRVDASRKTQTLGTKSSWLSSEAASDKTKTSQCKRLLGQQLTDSNRHGFCNEAMGRLQQPQPTAGSTQIVMLQILRRLAVQGLIDDITPKDEVGLMRLFERIYQSDAVAGPAVDLISTIPWSDWALTGIKDPSIIRAYEDAME